MRAVLYGKYADGSIRKPSKVKNDLLEDSDKLFEEYRKGVYGLYGKKCVPEEDQKVPEDE